MFIIPILSIGLICTQPPGKVLSAKHILLLYMYIENLNSKYIKRKYSSPSLHMSMHQEYINFVRLGKMEFIHQKKFL